MKYFKVEDQRLGMLFFSKEGSLFVDLKIDQDKYLISWNSLVAVKDFRVGSSDEGPWLIMEQVRKKSPIKLM